MWSSFTLTRQEAPSVLRERLASELAKPGRRYRGSVGPEGFEVSRVLGLFERTFRIVASGRFEAGEGGGTAVRIDTRPKSSDLLFLIGFGVVWCGGLLTAPGWETDWFRPWFLGGGVLFGWLLLFVSTAIEERRYQRDIGFLLNPSVLPGPGSSSSTTAPAVEQVRTGPLEHSRSGSATSTQTVFPPARLWAPMGVILFGVGVAAVLLFFFKARSLYEVHRAAGEGNVLRVRQLLDEQPSLLEKRNRLQMTPLHEAARLGRAKVVDLLAKRGADLNAHWDLAGTGDGHWTPLHLAAAGGHEETARVLVRAGADATAKTLKGQTPHDMAVLQGYQCVVSALEPGGQSP